MSLTALSPISAPDATRVQLPVPAHALPQRTPSELLAMARRGLDEAAVIRPAGLRYATAHLAALRAAAAVLAARAEPTPGVRRSKPTSVWTLVIQVAPELADWCAMFASGATKRAAAEAGVPIPITAAEADECRSRAAQFVDVVAVLLGVPATDPVESPGDLADTDGLPAGLSVLVDMAVAAMTPDERAAFAGAWTRAAEAAFGRDVSGIVGLYCEWRQNNLAAPVAVRAAKLVELMQAVAR